MARDIITRARLAAATMTEACPL